MNSPRRTVRTTRDKIVYLHARTPRRTLTVTQQPTRKYAYPRAKGETVLFIGLVLFAAIAALIGGITWVQHGMWPL